MRTFAVAMGLLALSATPAGAQSNPEAEQAFRDGKALMLKKQYAQACQAFATSDRLEPDVDTRINLADCHERRGKLATAWGLFLAIAAETRSDPSFSALHEVATERAAALEPRLPYLTISVPDGSRVEGLAITRNEDAVDAGLWNRAVPVDAGTYTVRARAPGREPWSTTVVIDAEGDRRSVDVPRFELALVVAGTNPPADTTEPSLPGRRRWLLPAILGGGGLLVGGGALALELSGRSTYADYRRTADPAQLDAANRKHHVAQGLALASAGCAIATVVFLWRRDESQPSRTAITPTIAGTTVGVAWTGRF
ncbi:MAG TPA: hypothetical protein VM261_08615 [Kofleriaceae bacterium]|nr:hypothetical protein [Kofleriaceae bacterium]